MSQQLTINNPVLNLTLAAHPFGGGGGGSAGTLSVFAEAGETISAGRCVVWNAGKVYKFNPSDPSHMRGVLGLTKTSALPGSVVEIVIAGPLNDAGFAFSGDVQLFAGAGGVVTQTPPSSGVVAPIGFSMGTNTVFVNINSSVLTL